MTAATHLKINLYLSIIIVLSLSAFKFSEAANCSTIIPNCITCNYTGNVTDCLLCADNFYYSTFRDYSNNTKKLCANQICQPNYGIVETSTYTTCKLCTISNCSQCHWTSAGVQTCLLCAANTYLSSDSQTCNNKSANISFTYYVQEAPYLAADIKASSQLARNGSYALPFYFLQQALVASELDSKSYINVTTTIYLMTGSHFFFQCDSSYYDPNAEQNSFDGTTALFSYCGNSSFTNISSYYFKNDNNKIYVKALTCAIAANLSLTSYSSLCVDLSTKYSGSKPTLFINSPRYYFNITSFAYFENIKFSGVNAFASLPTNPYAYFRYFPVQLCSMSSTVNDRYGQMKFATTLSESDIGFTYSCSDPFYAGSNIPKTLDLATKCNTPSSYRQSLGRCSGEVYNESYFTEYTYDYAVDTGSVYYEDRRKVLFNIYAFSDFYSVNKSAPMLILNSCDFEYFLYDYEALIYVETSNIYINTQPSYTNTTKNPYTFYTYTGNDRGANINITSSTFKYSRFCKGAIVYRKPQHQTDFAYIFNFTHQFSKNWNYSDSGSQILIVDSDFDYMNYMTNLTAISYHIEPALNKPFLPMYSGVASQAAIDYYVFFHMGIILNVDGFGGPIEISGCNINNNAFFIPEMLPFAQSNKEYFSIDYFKNTTTTELYFAACNYQTNFNQYFFQNGFDVSTDIDYLTTILERYSTFQIEKNKGVVIFKDSTFKENIGIFGGAISIYSPNFENKGNTPYVVIENCDFTNNMAYITGGAVFINPAIRQSELAQICAGVSISDSYFYQNMGMVKSTGGAVSIVCGHITNYITSFTGSSKINKTNITNSTILYDTQTIVELFHGNLTNFTDKIETTFYHKLYTQAVLIQDTVFEENYVGLKGAAVYIKYVSQVVVNNSEFSSNGPMYVDNELMISPYYVMFSANSIIFQDQTGTCFDEFDFFSNCSTPDNQIPLSQLEGALHINFCSEYICVNVNNTQNSLITGNIFRFNDVGPYLSPKQNSNLASALYINGGFNNTLIGNQFYGHYGNFEFQIHRRLQSFYWFMPEHYFNRSHAPVVRIITAPLNLLAKVSYITNFNGNRFWNNKNNQITGMSNAFQYYGSLIYYTSNVESTSVVQTYFNMTYNTFSNNMFIGNDGSLIYIYNALMNLTSNVFSGNGYISRNITENYPSNEQKFNFKFNNYSFQYASHHGIFWVDADYKFNSYHYIYNNTFNYSSAREGSIFYFKFTNQTVLLVGNQYSYLFALESGSYMSASSSTTTNTIQMVNETISYSYCGLDGAIYSYNQAPYLMNFIINQTTFANCYANYGSAISVFQTGKILCFQDRFVRNVYANETEFVYSQLQQNISLVQGFIDNDTLYFLTNTYQGMGHIYLGASGTSLPLMFRTYLIQAISYPYITYNEFIDCYFFQLINQFGSAIYSVNSNVRIFQSNGSSPTQGIYSSTSDFGAVYISALSTLNAENVQFSNNTAVYDGSVLYFKQSYANITHCNFTKNNGSGQGTIYLYFKSQINITSSTFKNNYAYDSSAIFANKNHNILQNIINTTFTNNTSVLNLFNLDYSNLTFDRCSFMDNIATYVTHGFTLSNSGLHIQNSIVNYTLDSFLNHNPYQVLAGFFNLIYGSILTLTSGVQILGTRGSEAGAIYALTNSIISITQGVLFQNCQSSIGPCIYISETQSVNIDSSQFLGNSLIDIQLSSSIISISNSLFDQGSDQYLSATDSYVTLKGVTMQNVYSPSILGSGIYCDCQVIDFENCTFYNLQGVEGGAVYLLLSNPDIASTIVQSNFMYNSAQLGGALYINSIDSLIITSSNFIGNRAYFDESLNTTLTLDQGMGGAIFYLCSDPTVPCVLTLQDGNNFTNNYASHQGGAIIWLTSRYIESGIPSIYNQNTATYGSDIASYPKELKMTMVSSAAVSSRMLSVSDLIDISNSTDGSTDNSTQSNWTIVSGNGFYFVMSILDQDGLDYTIDNQTVANIVSIDKINNITLNNAQAVAKMGVFTFKNIEVTVVPGTAISLYVQISGLESYASNIAFVDDPEQIDFYVRLCEAGESYTSDYQCLTCPVNYYLFDVNNSFSTCKTCDVNAKCYYGAVVTPLKGYWRSSIYSENFMKCPNAKVCVGGDQTDPLGKCATGYSGILCGECDTGYSLVDDFQCQACPSTGADVVRLIVFYIFGVILTMILVYGTISNLIGNQSQFQVFVKIFINHFQEIGIILAINSSWSSIIQSFVGNQQSAGSILQQFFSVNCLIKAANLNYKVFYQKMILKVFIPIVFIGIGILGGIIYQKVKGPDIKQKDLNVCIAVIILFLIYPDLCITIFESFNCVEVDSDLRLIQDLSIICYSTKGSAHLFVILFVTLPALVVWVIGFPAYMTLQFVKQKQLFKDMEKVEEDDKNANSFQKRTCRIRFGFFSNGFVNDRYYWFELVILYRKVLLILIVTYLEALSTDIQTLLCLLVLVISLFAQLIRHPYKTNQFNRLEMMSLIVLCITLYAALFFIQNELYGIYNDTVLGVSFFIIILVPNLALFVYFIYLIRIEVLIYVFPMNKLLFTLISCCLIKRKDFQEKYFPDPDIVRKENKRKEDLARSQKASGGANSKGGKPSKSQIGGGGDYEKDPKNEDHEEDNDSQNEEKKQDSEEADMDKVLNNLFQKPMNQNNNKMFDGIIDHKQIVINFQDINKSYNVTIEDDEKFQQSSKRKLNEQDEEPDILRGINDEERKSGSNEQDRDDQVETDHEKMALVESNQPRRTINNLNQSFNNPQNKQQLTDEQNKYGMTFGSGQKQKRQLQLEAHIKEMKHKEAEDKNVLQEDESKDLKFKSNPKPAGPGKKFERFI